MKKVIFIGGVGAPNVFGGELTKNKYLIEALRHAGEEVHVVDTHGAHKHPWRMVSIFTSLLINPRTNVIISTSLGNIYWLVKLFYHLKTKRHICYFGIGGSFPKQTIKGHFDRKYLHIFSTIVVEGANMQRELKSCGLDSIVVPNFKRIDYLPNLAITRDDSAKTRFVFLSRLHPEKGVDLILDAVKRLNEDGLQNRFIVDFYGGFDNDEYQKHVLSKLSELPNVKYQGKLDLMESKGFDRLSSYDIMLFPTYWNGEGFPGIVIDSYIAGLPLIASDWNINPEFIEDGKTGRIIRNQDFGELFLAMKEAIEDKSVYSAMSAYCQQCAMKYEADHVINTNLLKKIIKL